MTPCARKPALRRLLATGSLLVLTIAALQQPASANESSSPLHTTTKSAALQAKVAQARAAYQEARTRVEAVSEQASRLDHDADRAEAKAEHWRQRVADQDGGFLHAVGDWIAPGESELDRAAEAAHDAEDARDLSDLVQQALGDSIADAEQARGDWERAQRQQARLEARWTAQQFADHEIRRAHLPLDYSVSNTKQDLRNREALDAWHGYLQQVAAARVVPPPADQLVHADDLAQPFEAIHDAGNAPMPGVAQVDRPGKAAVTILPVEAVHAISDSFRRLGLTTAPDGVDATTYACGGLLANAWGASMLLPADASDQWQQLAKVARDALQPGDTVVLGGKRAGLGVTGVYLGGGRLVTADPQTGTAAVKPLPGKGILGVRRPSLGVDDTGSSENPAPPAGGTCGVPDPATVATGDGKGPLALPMAPGSYHLSSGFGDAGELWSSGEHTGQDFAAPIGTPVAAAGPGTVTIEHPGWAGNLVRVDHGGGVETLYAHLSEVDVTDGQTVETGDRVGLVGEEGNTTGPHLHFEVRLDGSPVDPTAVVDVPEAPRPTFENGAVPDGVLCDATPDGGQRLDCEAAVAFRLMSAAFESELGTPICITDSYRSRDGQERTFAAKPGLAAVPGTSIHGYGRAVDLCGGIERFDTAEHAWLVAHGPTYGWTHPAWAEPGGSRPEPWHFEYAD